MFPWLPMKQRRATCKEKNRYTKSESPVEKFAPLDFIGPLGIDEEVPHLGVLKRSEQRAMPISPLWNMFLSMSKC